MSLIIKGMKLPEKCEDCPCYDYIDYVCRADDCFAPFDVENPEERSEHCPLIEIPAPHGRLIDADKAATSISMMNNHPCGNSIETVNDVVEWLRFVDEHGTNITFPTIIEAEVSE